jgi:hypothetical protein
MRRILRAIDCAVQLVKALEAKASAVAFEFDIRVPIGVYTDFVNIRGMLATEHNKCYVKSPRTRRTLRRVRVEIIAVFRGHEGHSDTLCPWCGLVVTDLDFYSAIRSHPKLAPTGLRMKPIRLRTMLYH